MTGRPGARGERNLRITNAYVDPDDKRFYVIEFEADEDEPDVKIALYGYGPLGLKDAKPHLKVYSTNLPRPPAKDGIWKEKHEVGIADIWGFTEAQWEIRLRE